MYYYHRMWLSVLVLAIVTTSMCGFANEHDVSENDNIKHDAHLQTQAAASLKELTEPELSDDLSVELYRSLRFEPPQLDFGIWSVGKVRSHTVTLINDNRNRSVYLSSVSGRTPAFLSSFFDAKIVPPNGNTTFKVVFLPREQGAISTSLNVHTSFGKLRLLVSGIGRECPYRLKPLVCIRAPLNATLMPEIHMYNPHEKALQILEVYSSGGQFQLELPSDDSEAPRSIWEIPPLTTKPIIRIRFQGYAAGNYSAYIRIKIAEPRQHTSDESSQNDVNNENEEVDEEQVLVIPVEFEILPQYGLYAVNPLLEFGHIAVDDDSPVKVLKKNIFIRHSKSQLDVNDLEFKSITNISGVYVQDSNIIALHPNDVENPVVHLNDKLELVLKDKKEHTYHNVELMIKADIFKGDLNYDFNKTLFLIPTHTSNKLQQDSDADNSSRVLTVRNYFQIPIAIYNITTQDSDNAKLSLELKSFEKGMVIRPGLSFDLIVAFSLCKQQEEDLKDLVNYKTAIYVYTNITKFEIPIVITSARLFVTTQTASIWRSNTSVFTKDLDLGSVPLRKRSNDGFVILHNRNSIPIKSTNFNVKKFQGIYYSVHYMGRIKAADINETNNYTIDLKKAHFEFNTVLEEGDIAVYTVNIQPYTTEHSLAYLFLSTQYENITINIRFSPGLGRLEVDQEKLHFASCFPGKLCSSELSIRSTFMHPIHIKYINFTDPGLRFEDKNPLGSKITPQSVTTVGRIYFRPSVICGSRCYIQQQTDESSIFPSSAVFKSLNIPNFDEIELRRRTELYRHFKYYYQNMDFTMTTKEMKHFQLNLMIELEWPQLVSGVQILPTIQVNKTHIHYVKITNPSDNPILIDYTLADPTLAKHTHISLPLEVVVTTSGCYLTDKDVFSLVDTPPKKPILIPGLSSVTIPIKFQTDYVGTICTLLHIRNNLTLYEGVWISAKTVQSQFRLGNRKPGSQTPLLFEISEQHVASACPPRDERIRSGTMEQHILPQIILRRAFTARNSGELPIRIDGFWIANEPCEGYGFQITNCSSFELMANSSKKIEISFQSDFTQTRIAMPLILKTNLTYDVSYLLVAQLPSKGLEQCEFLLPRPLWEGKLRNGAIVILVVTFVLLLITVHIDYNKIIYTQSVLYEARDKGTVHPTFNLRNIAMRSTESTNDNVNIHETNLRIKTKASPAEKNDNATSTLGLKKRNKAINLKTSNVETMSSLSSVRSSMTLTEMVSNWTFGPKITKKSATNNNKNAKATEQVNVNINVSTLIGTDAKTVISVKSKLNEKSLIDKMDSDNKKPHINKKSKVSDKIQNKNYDKGENEEVKLRKDDNLDKEVKKEKNSPKLQTKPTNKTNSMLSEVATIKDNIEHRKSLELSSQVASVIAENPANQNSPKETTNVKKISRTPGRERRKHPAQNLISELTSSSCSSSTSSSCSSNHNATGKRNDRKTKAKVVNSLKFPNSTSATNTLPTSSSVSAPSSLISTNILKSDNTNSHLDILSPWDSGSHATFSDVLQKSQKQSTTSTDLIQQQGSLFDLMPNSRNSMENSEITTALTPKRPKNTASDLGPIGSRKSPSSTPNWEPIQSAITMQLPRPLNTTSPNSASTSSPGTCYSLNSSFGYNDLSPTLQQHQHNIQPQYLGMQRTLFEQQQLQQQHQFNNSNALNNNWSNLSLPLWCSMLGNESTANSNNSTSIFSTPHTQNSTWGLTSLSSGGLVRPPPGLEQNFSINNNLTAPLNSHQTLSSAAVTSSPTVISSSTQLPSTFNNAMSNSPNSLTQSPTNNDNMPQFDLFSGLSSIWTEDWRQSTNQQQSPENSK